jgi:hypothetical protein
MTTENTQTNGFDLDAPVVQEPTFNVGVILDADGEDVTGFTVVGKNSPEYQEAARKIRVRTLQRSSKRKTAIDMSTEDGAAIIAKTIEENELALSVSVLKDWFGFGSGGTVAPFDKTKATALLVRFPTWREKIAAALEVDANFLKG